MKFRHVLATAIALAISATTVSAAEFNLRLHTLVKSPHPYNDMAAYMKKTLEEKSDGRIAVQIFDSGQLGQDPAVISELAFGTIDMMISTTSNAAEQVPEYGIFTMPYLFSGMDGILDKIGPGTKVQEHFEKIYEDRGLGMRLLALGASGTRNLATTDKPVNTLADLKGMRMRTPPSPMDSETWSALGMLPVTIAWGELYAALQTGVVSAMESSLPGYSGAKLYEVAPYLALTQHTLQINHISISDVTWNKLPEDLQKLVQQTAIEANTLGVQKAIQYDSELVKSLQADHGVKVTHPDTAAFRAKLEPIQAQLAKKVGLSQEYELLTAK
ncbi:TRAP transporter substrate-binding protein [Jiella mangrovi]|uniref:TRAP transporter substrate-binding protein n=1 Tax=Jiella mangrovi TaxID=2821407 RepID=A0ABS4BHB2_9HYPH|nr:TRAP transporter substrate-binding protein [Jiella mangrovi]MBP0616137.1 TRAP transporter substrate-binding protein [Jiella mangrovi]